MGSHRFLKAALPKAQTSKRRSFQGVAVNIYSASKTISSATPNTDLALIVIRTCGNDDSLARAQLHPVVSMGLRIDGQRSRRVFSTGGLREPKESRDSFACQYYIAIARAMLMM
jgi:hypothetical protein